MNPVYFDNCATTKLDDRVLEAMLPFLRNVYGNPASKSHHFGRDARDAVAKAKAVVADLLGTLSPDNITFTSGATESILTALGAGAGGGAHIVTSKIEHKAVLQGCERLERSGVSVSYVAPTFDGEVLSQDVMSAMRAETHLISIMAANNETGVINKVEQIGALAHDRNVLFHTDATQFIGKCRASQISACADMVSCSGHKIYGPKGVGILVTSAHAQQELLNKTGAGLGSTWPRSGTLNVPGIVGFAKALELAESEYDDVHARISKIATMLEMHLKEIPRCQINGSACSRVLGVTSVTCIGCDIDALMIELEQYALSTGSACNSGSGPVSNVLLAMGRSLAEARSTLRISVGKYNNLKEINSFCEDFRAAVNQISSLFPDAEMSLCLP